MKKSVWVFLFVIGAAVGFTVGKAFVPQAANDGAASPNGVDVKVKTGVMVM